ncbi:MAG: beta-lactamase class [Mycobacteriales bacterium]
MAGDLNRRAALGLGTVVAGGVVLGTARAVGAVGGVAGGAEPAATPPGAPKPALAWLDAVYRWQAAKAGGTWNSYVSLTDQTGTPQPAVVQDADTVVQAYSVNKIAVATALLDKVDRGLIALDQHVDVTAAIIIPDGDGIFRLDRAYPSSITVGHALAALLTISDDTAVRLCGLVVPAAELNQIMVAKGFPNTQVVPVANPNRFFLGTTTPKEMHDLLRALVGGTLLSAASTDHLLSLIRSPIAFTDGIRRTMSSDERLRVGTKAGWFADGRNEAGIMFDPTGAPVLTYSFFAHGQEHPEDFGATHPAVQARAVIGRRYLDAVDRLTGVSVAATRSYHAPAYQPSNGG